MRLRTASAGLATVLAAGLVASVPTQALAQSGPVPETFTIVVAGSAPQLFVARGAIDVTGTAVPVVMEGPAGGTDLIELPGGTFMLTLQNTGGGGAMPAPCVNTFYGTGTSTIFDGTGKFTGIEGSGTLTFHGAFIQTPTATGCSQAGTVFDLVVDQGTITPPAPG